MEIKEIEIKHDEKSAKIEIYTNFDNSDKDRLKNIYCQWRSLCDSLREMNSRAVNIPDGLSEIAVCIALKIGRFRKKISGELGNSFDAYDENNNKRVQIKACSVIPDLTSFGPRSEYDMIYFADFYVKGKWNGDFKIYEIPKKVVLNIKVNKNQTFENQQKQDRRPRFSIYTEIVSKNNNIAKHPFNVFNL